MWVAAAAMAAVVCALVFGVAADLAMLVALGVLLVLGVVSPGEAARGFGNEGLLTVAALYVVAAGLQRAGAVRWLVGGLLRPAAGERQALLRMCPPVAGLSALLNNTPIVAFMIPAVQDWARRSRIPASKLLIPLSYATILGGTLTLIGTSTNLVVVGLIGGVLAGSSDPPAGLRALGFFELTPVGLPLLAVGLAYIVVLAPRLLPAREPVISVDEAQARRYTISASVRAGGALDGLTIEEARLRRMEGLFVVEIVRGTDAIPAPPPTQRLRGGDLVVFAGVVQSVAELHQVRGLDIAGEHAVGETAHSPTTRGRRLVEAVVSNTFPGLGVSIRDFGFRTRYDAAVIAVSRNGERLPGRLGDAELRAGDTLLLDAAPGFVERNRNNRDFYLVGDLDAALEPIKPLRALLAAAILVGMVVAATWSGDMLVPTFAAAGLMLVTRCVSIGEARTSLDLSTLLVIGASLGLSKAIESTGLGTTVGGGVVALAGSHPIASLAAVYGATMLFTSFASNAAAAAIMFPIALGTAAVAGCDPMPFVLAVLFAASADFATPIGYQTNLMVAGPGGYRFTDFLRVGAPLNAMAWITTVTVLSLVYRL